MRIPYSICLIAAAALAGCATSTPPAGAPPAAATGTALPAGPLLADEQQRLAEALAGTPVTTEMTPDGRLRVQVPADFSFDVGRAVVKPPLAAVLELMATGLKKQRTTTVRLAAPADPKGAGGLLLAQDRAASARDYLVSRGVQATRFGPLTRADNVEIVVSNPAAAP